MKNMKELKSLKNCQFKLDDMTGSHDTRDSVLGQWVQVLRTGEFQHPMAPEGKFNITLEQLYKMAANFNENTRRLETREIAVDYSHESGNKAAGWIKEIEVRNEKGGELWTFIEWTRNARKMLDEKEFRFISADIDFQYSDNESPEVDFGAVLLGAGLTNRPHIKGMEAVFSERVINNENAKGKFAMTPEEMLKKIGELEAAIATMKSQLQAGEDNMEAKEASLVEAGETLQASEAKVKELEAKNSELETEKTNIQKEAKFAELLGEGKVTPAQKEDFLKMEITLAESFFKNAKPQVNLKGEGHGGKGAEGKVEGDAADQIHAKTVELMEEKKGLTLTEATKVVLGSNPELAKQYDAESINSVQ